MSWWWSSVLGVAALATAGSHVAARLLGRELRSVEAASACITAVTAEVIRARKG